MSATSLLLLLSLIGTTSPAIAQIVAGDLLLNSNGSPEILVHFRPDGTVLQTSGVGTGISWLGAGILPNGNWVATRRLPDGVNIFDGVTGAEIATWNMPGGFVRGGGDVGVFSDGTIAVVELQSKVWRLNTNGTVITSWTIPGSPFGLLVDRNDHVWACDVKNGVLWHTDGFGNKINEFSTGGAAGDVTMARDGTLFLTRRDTGEVAHYTQDGTLLGVFMATGKIQTYGIAMAVNDTLWVSGSTSLLVRNFDQAGNLLGSFHRGPVPHPAFLTILVNREDLGTNFCGPAISNSTGQSAVISALGDPQASNNFVQLTARLLPSNVFGYFMNSDVKGFRPFPPGSQGTLCLGGTIGRHAKQIGSSESSGELTIDLDLTALPRLGGTHSVVAGETWNFQCWFRDNNGGPTSNFTDGIEIVFQ